LETDCSHVLQPADVRVIESVALPDGVTLMLIGNQEWFMDKQHILSGLKVLNVEVVLRDGMPVHLILDASTACFIVELQSLVDASDAADSALGQVHDIIDYLYEQSLHFNTLYIFICDLNFHLPPGSSISTLYDQLEDEIRVKMADARLATMPPCHIIKRIRREEDLLASILTAAQDTAKAYADGDEQVRPYIQVT